MPTGSEQGSQKKTGRSREWILLQRGERFEERRYTPFVEYS